jgi:hypothetical protein
MNKIVKSFLLILFLILMVLSLLIDFILSNILFVIKLIVKSIINIFNPRTGIENIVIDLTDYDESESDNDE